jgi:DNA-binding transcriptional MerR regulator
MATTDRNPCAPDRFARVAFTGRMARTTRRRATAIVVAAGGRVTTNVSRRTSMLVVGSGGWPVLADGSVSVALRRAETLNERGAGIDIVSEVVFLERAGETTSPPEPPGGYDLEQVSALLGLEPRVLVRWEAQGLVRSRGGRYDFQDIVALRTIAELIGRGVTPATIATSVRMLSRVLPDAARPLAQLKLVEESGTLFAELEGARLAPDGQLVLDFGATTGATGTEEPATPALRLDRRDVHAERSASAWFERATRLEADERLEEAAAAYRAALVGQDPFPVAHYNLGNVLRALGREHEGEDHLRRAVEQDPTLACAWFNLADIQEERGALDEAIESLEAALRADPGYADARYNLALCCEEAGRTAVAREHWRAYLALDATSPWAETAREHLRRTEHLD